MYLKKITTAGEYMRVEKYHSGRLGNHNPRNGHTNKTPPQIAEINQRKAEERLLDLIRANFKRGVDCHVVLTYSGVPPDPATAKQDKAKFIRKLKKDYIKAGDELKYIHVVEYEGKRIHHHFIMNHIKNAELIIKEWEKKGIAHIIALYSKDFEALADYLIKETSVRTHSGNGYRRRWSCSQNLIKPKIKIQRIHSKKWKKDPPDKIKEYKLLHGTVFNMVDINGRPMQRALYRKE